MQVIDILGLEPDTEGELTKYSFLVKDKKVSLIEDYVNLSNELQERNYIFIFHRQKLRIKVVNWLG